jgi:hypothetical protein
VVVTHWDDDHIQGIGQVAAVCTNAVIACSAALRRKDVLAFVLEAKRGAGRTGSGLDELRAVLRVSRDSARRLLWAKANLPLYPQPPGNYPAVVALAPSENSVERSIESLVSAAVGQRIVGPRRYTAPEGPNGASVVTEIRAAGHQAILGADLENSANPEAGWNAVIEYAKPDDASSLFKVAHHGSDGADHPDIWSRLLDDNVMAILTPWSKGARYLPTEEDLQRLRGSAGRLFLAARPGLSRVSKDAKVERLIRRLHATELQELRGWGHVRARRAPGGGAWSVELDGDAVEVLNL